VGTGWRRLIGSPKLQISFYKRATKYRSLLRKMTHKDKGSYESSPPCSLAGAYEWETYIAGFFFIGTCGWRNVDFDHTHIRAMTQYVTWLKYVTWLIDVWHDSLTCDMIGWWATRRIDVWYDSIPVQVFIQTRTPSVIVGEEFSVTVRYERS